MKRILSYILCILILSVFLAFICLHKKEKLIKNPSAYLPVKKLDRIIASSRLRIETNPEDIFSYIEIGIANYQKGKEFYPAGINYLKKALKLGAADTRILFYLGIMYDEMNLTEKAFNYYEKFLRNRPKDVYIRIRYGNLYFRLHRYSAASKQYEIATGLDPKNQTAVINLALSYKARRLYDEALGKFKQAENLNSPLPPDILIKIAETYFIKEDFENAEIYCEKAINDKPDSSVAFLKLGEIYLKQDKKNEAEKCFRKVIGIDPENSEAKEYLSKK
ncbi:MAG: tetratricopeptide repeat protein [Elusimicrobia bacterium]|nr:tetratricopeptide repeat protein [Elusimicrobiota bacterium]